MGYGMILFLHISISIACIACSSNLVHSLTPDIYCLMFDIAVPEHGQCHTMRPIKSKAIICLTVKNPVNFTEHRLITKNIALLFYEIWYVGQDRKGLNSDVGNSRKAGKILGCQRDFPG